MSARFALRAATADAHERLDALFSRFDLGDRAGYSDFLRAQAGAFTSVEAALDDAGAATVIDDWDARQRSQALKEDMAVLNVSAPPPVAAPGFPTEAAVLGGLYVLEGSRLGGAMLVRTVPDSLPKSFLAPGNPAAWRAFVGVLDRRLSSPQALADATLAATAVFEAFESSARAILEPIRSDD